MRVGGGDRAGDAVEMYLRVSDWAADLRPAVS